LIYDVVIAGGGPVGLLLACELRLADLSVLILEQGNDPRSPLKRLPFGMRGLSAPSIEAFYRRGLLNDISAPQPAKDGSAGSSAATAAHWMQQSHRPGGHFAGIQFYQDNIDTSKWAYRLPSPAGTHMAVEMEYLESALAARAIAIGVEIRRGRGVEDLDQSDKEVTIRAVRRFADAGSLDVMAAAARFARRVASTSSAAIPSSPVIPLKSIWRIRRSFASAGTIRPRACIPILGPGRSRWLSSTGAPSTEPSRSRSRMCRRYCAVSRAPTSL
jgi:hypothetical protein